MTYHFDIYVEKDLTIERKGDMLVFRFEKPSSLFALVEELGLVESGLLVALGYGEER